MLNLEPSRSNLDELAVMLRQREVTWVDDFISLQGVEALSELLELLEKKAPPSPAPTPAALSGPPSDATPLAPLPRPPPSRATARQAFKKPGDFEMMGQVPPRPPCPLPTARRCHLSHRRHPSCCRCCAACARS